LTRIGINMHSEQQDQLHPTPQELGWTPIKPKKRDWKCT